MTLEVLISCMNQKDLSIVRNSNIQTNTVIINQCDDDGYIEENFSGSNGDQFVARMFSTQQRGLSRSRNLAISKSSSDICLFCDDDIQYAENYSEIVLNAFDKYKGADVILFNIKNLYRKPISKPGKENYLTALRAVSPQIAFKREKLIEKGIVLDETMGSGTGNGGGEETKLIYDCLRAGLNVFSVPDVIASVDKSNPSMWFNGYDSKFLIKKGWATRKIMGRFFGTFYALYFAIAKYKEYKKDCSFMCALSSLMNGVYVHKV